MSCPSPESRCLSVTSFFSFREEDAGPCSPCSPPAALCVCKQLRSLETLVLACQRHLPHFLLLLMLMATSARSAWVICPLVHSPLLPLINPLSSTNRRPTLPSARTCVHSSLLQSSVTRTRDKSDCISPASILSLHHGFF